MADIHNPRVIGDMSLTRAPSRPEHPVRKQDLDEALVGVTSSRALFITDITPTDGGIVSSKAYADTVPANGVLVSAVSDTNQVRIHFTAQGALFVPPSVVINGQTATEYQPTVTDMFTGYIDLVLEESTEIRAEMGTSAASATLVLATEGPAVSMLTIGALPGQQTEVKQGDTVAFTCIVENEATVLTVQNKGAATSGSGIAFGANNSAGEGLKTVTGQFTVANRSGAQNLYVVSQNALGTVGEEATSVQSITLNQTSPTISTIEVTYPNAQGALKVGEVATVRSTVTGADAVTYTTSADADILDPETYGADKQLTLNAGGYNYSSNNYTIRAVKASNGAVTSRNGVVRIAVDAPTSQIIVVGNPARLRSSAAGLTYTLRVTASQQLAGNPTVTLTSGEWDGEWSFSGGAYNRTFTITDSDARGPMNVDATFIGLAGVEGSADVTFQVGGFAARDLTFSAFSQIVPMGVRVSDINKVRVNYTGTSGMLKLRNDVQNEQAAFTIVNAEGQYDPQGTHLWLSDAAYAGSNTSGTLQATVEEIA